MHIVLPGVATGTNLGIVPHHSIIMHQRLLAHVCTLCVHVLPWYMQLHVDARANNSP